MKQKIKSKVEIQMEKQKEREELQKLYEYNPFGRSGSGAPIRDSNGNLQLTRKTIADGKIYIENGNPFIQNRQYTNELSYSISSNPQFQKTSLYSPQYAQNRIDQPEYLNQNLKQNYHQTYSNNQFNDNPSLYFPPNIPNNYQNQNISQNINNNNLIDNFQYPPYNKSLEYNPLPGQYQLNYLNQLNRPIEYNHNIYQNQQNFNPNLPELNSSYNNIYKPVQMNVIEKSNQPPAKSISQSQAEIQAAKKLEYQNSLLLQIQENKKRKEMETLRNWENERLEDEKIRKHLEKLSDIQKKEQDKRLKYIKNNDNDLLQIQNEITPRNFSPQKLKLNHEYGNNEPQQLLINEFSNLKVNLNQEIPIIRDHHELIDFTSRIKRSFDNINNSIENSIDNQIVSLKKDIYQNHRELTDSIMKIKSDAKDISFIKMNSEREFEKVRDLIEKRKIRDNLNHENRFNDIFEKSYSPNKSVRFNTPKLDPNQFLYKKTDFQTPNYSNLNSSNNFSNLNNAKNFSHDLISTSKMVYSNDELLNEKFDFEEKIPMSKLANYGKSLIGDSQFVPINDNKKESNIIPTQHQSDQVLSEGINENETFYSFKKQDTREKNLSTPAFNVRPNKSHVVNNHNNDNSEGLSTLELNDKIDDLARINYINDPSSKYNALRKKVDNDLNNIDKNNVMIDYYNNKKYDQEKKLDMKKLDNLLDSLILDDKKQRENQDKKLNNKDNSKDNHFVNHQNIQSSLQNRKNSETEETKQQYQHQEEDPIIEKKDNSEVENAKIEEDEKSLKDEDALSEKNNQSNLENENMDEK